MGKEFGYGQMKHSDKAPDFARGTGAPPICKSHEKAHSRNTLDQAKAPAPDSGQTAGGSRQGGKKGSNSPKE